MVPFPASILLNFKFMKHDRWDNALFLHWKIPLHLEKVLEENTHPFELERYPDKNGDGKGSYYVGLILLTEQAVGPAVGRSHWTTVTHHGVNVRTYVHGIAGTTTRQYRPGIHFSSLECNDELTSWGANWFGMPYQVGTIERCFDDQDEENKDGKSATNFRLVSRRGGSPKPSIIRLIGNAVTRLLRKATKTQDSTAQASFTVDCTWSLCNNDSSAPATDFAKWAVERYYVYTHKYGLNWSGQVEHEPWPLESVKLDSLKISDIESYEPSGMRPILEHMANHPPDSVLFSRGVGPVLFNMLRTV